MKRSQINAIIQAADVFLKTHQFFLPPWAYWTPEEWMEKGEAVSRIVERRLGWDMTDFGSGDFERIGLSLFTLRNGSLKDLAQGSGEIYCEKILIVGVGQVTPLHFHWAKTEDIINRGGGRLVVQLYNANEAEEITHEDVVVYTDGIRRRVKAGASVVLDPGESITLRPYCYHAFWAVDGPVLAGEVSTVNDDSSDNRFYDPIGRFPEIEEDEAPLTLMVNDYEKF